MRKTFGAALVAAAIAFVGCGGDSEQTPRAFEEPGPVESSWDKVQPKVDQIESGLMRLTDRNEILRWSADVVEATEDRFFEDGRYDGLRKLARKTDSYLVELVGDGGPLVRARDIASDITEYTTSEFDDGTVSKVLGWTQDLSAELKDTVGNNLIDSVMMTTDKLVAQFKKVTENVKTEQVVTKTRDLLSKFDQRVDEAFEDGGTLDKLYDWSLDLVTTVKELIKP